MRNFLSFSIFDFTKSTYLADFSSSSNNNIPLNLKINVKLKESEILVFAINNV